MQPAQKSILDWVTLTTRWVFVCALSLWLAFHSPLDYGLLIVAMVMVLENLVIVGLVLTGQLTPLIRFSITALDLLFAHLALAMAGLPNSLAWLVFLPLVTAALYYRWMGALAVAILNGLVSAGLMTLIYSGEQLLVPGVLSLLSLVIGLPLAFFAQKVPDGVLGDTKVGLPLFVAEHKERERRRSIFEMIAVLNESLNYQRVLETSLDLSASTLDDLKAPAIDRLVSAVLLFTHSNRVTPELQIATSRNLIAGERGSTLPATSGLLAKVIDEGQPQLTRGVNVDPELSRLSSFSNCKSAYGIPLRTGLDAYGLLLFAHPKADFFTSERKEVLDIIGKQSVIAIQNARLYQDLEQEKNRIMDIQEESRKKLARDLHDGPTQSVSAIAMRVNFARRLMERDGKAAAEELYKIEELARRTTKEIRHMLFTLRPLVLESRGLVPALESMAVKMQETFQQNVIIQADPAVIEVLETGKQAVVFYIAEEAVNNARKHANASHVWVRLKLLRDSLILLEVEDDGVGFDVNAVGSSYENRGSMGMINLRERTQLVNGALHIDSTRGMGTRVQVVIPLTEEAAERIHRAV